MEFLEEAKFMDSCTREVRKRQILRITDPCGKCTGWIRH